MASGMDRRMVLRIVGAGLTVGLAGCSGNGSDEEDGPSSGEGDQPNSETQTEQDQSTDTESTTEQTETSTEGSSEDTVHEGEEELEEFIGYRSDFIEDDPDYYWIELEDPIRQIESPVQADGFSEDRQFNYFVENGSYATSQTGTECKIDALYLTIPETGLDPSDTGTGGEQQREVFAFNEEAWDQNVTLQENIDQNVYWRNGLDVSEGVSEEDMETLFSEDIQSCNYLSEDFPQEYLDLIDG